MQNKQNLKIAFGISTDSYFVENKTFFKKPFKSFSINRYWVKTRRIFSTILDHAGQRFKGFARRKIVTLNKQSLKKTRGKRSFFIKPQDFFQNKIKFFKNKIIKKCSTIIIEIFRNIEMVIYTFKHLNI